MAETYRGLTIRIGGDTTKLTQALHASNQAITGTQSAMRKLNEALKLDPTSFSAAAMQAGALANQAANTASRLLTLNDAVRSVGDEVHAFDGLAAPIKEMAESWGNVNMQASQTRDFYKDVTAALATTYAQFTKTYDEASKLASVKMTESWELGKTGLDQMLAAIKQMSAEFNSNDSQVNRFSESITELQGRYSKLAAEYEKYQHAVATETDVAKFTTAAQKLVEIRQRMSEVKQEFQSYLDSFDGFNSEEVFRYDAANTDLANLARALYDCVQAERMSSEEADELYDKFARMKDMWKQAFENVQTANVVEGFHDLEAESEKASAKVKSLVDEMVRLAGTSDVAKTLGETSERVSEIDERYKSAEESIKRIDAALKTDPKNVELLAAKARAVADAQELAAEKATLLKQKIDAYQSDKVKALATDTRELASQITIATENFRNSASSLTTYEAMISAVTQRMNKLKSDDKVDTDEYRELNEQLDLLKAAFERATEAYKKAKSALQEPLEASELRELKTELEATRVSAENLGKTDATPKVDQAAFMQSISMVANAMKRLSGDIVTSSDTIDSAYRDMRKTVNGTESEFEALLDSAIKFSQTSITSADTMLEMQALGGQLGVLTEDLEQFGRITSSLDIATDMDAEDIALRLGQIGNVLSLDIDGMQGFSDALVRLGNNMPAQESAIMNVAQRLAAVASTANFSGSEILAWSAAIASTGQRSEAAATAIGNTISGIESAIAEGGDSIQAFATIAGRSADDFAKIWKDNPTEALREFLTGLQTINESTDSAVAALENMGITGVRQQQTLLGLSKTVESLDKALEMSENAWNGISDQWGDAGDAAVEAAKKSEGFSGSLAIMRNNASNLAASLGEGFIPAMDLAAKTMQLLTDILNDMPAPMKTAIVSVGGIAAVLGTVVPITTQFSKGWQAAAQMAVNSGGPIGALVTKLTGLEASATAATAAAGGLTSGLSLMSTLGIAGCVVALGTLVGKLLEVKEHQDAVTQATAGFANAASSSSTGYQAYVDGLENAKVSTKGLIDEIDALIAKQGELAGSMANSWSQIGTDEATVDAYVSTIERLAGTSDQTAGEMAELAAAVEGFNGITGAELSITDAMNGTLSESTDYVNAYAQAWRDSVEYAQNLEDYQNATERLAANSAELERVQSDLGSSMRSTQSAAQQMGFSVGSTASELWQLNGRANELRSAIESDEAVLERASSAMGYAQGRIGTLQGAIVNAGHSLSEYANVTAQQWAFIASIYGNNVNFAISQLDKLAAAQSGVTKGMTTYTPSVPVSSGSGSSGDSAARKAQQRANDAAYKAQQRAYDKEYKAAQKAYDAEYKALQKTLDKKYDAEKKSLDAIYKQRKKYYDAQLKALKDAQDDEVDAFNDATNAKLKEMEREYKARLKLLEEQYGVSAIDDQIEALEAETEAEKRALEERKQQEKVAELQSAVDKAKSRRKRAEAEQALNDYLLEIQQKHNEQTRKDQIEALKQQKEDIKDELATRKEELKEQYDAEVEAYKESRADQLEALKDANTVEYDTMKEKYDTLLEQLKESHTLQLESLKEAQTAQLEALKESQTEQLEALKEYQQDQLQAMKDAQQDALDALSSSSAGGVAIMDAAEQEMVEDLDAHAEEFNATLSDMAEESKAKAEETSDNIASSLEAELPRVNTASMGYYQSIMDPMNRLTGDGKRVGTELTDGVTSSMRRGAPITVSTASGIVQQVDTELSKLEDSAEEHSENASEKMASGFQSSDDNILDNLARLFSNMMHSFERGGDDLERSAGTIASNVESEFSGMGGGTFTWGYDFILGLNNGVVNAWNNILFPNIRSIAGTIEDWLGHSVPDKGPLKDDDKWGADFVMNLVNGMHDKESELYKQIQRMSEIVEDGFDPDVTLDAAYEAVNGIRSNAAKRRKGDATNEAPVINMTMNLDVSNVTVRSDQDIDRLADEISKRMAAAAARQMAGRL